MRTLNILGGALKILLVAAILVTDWFIWPQAFRQFQYGDTWVRVHLINGRARARSQTAARV